MKARSHPPGAVYVLELAGEDDGYAIAEAAVAAEAVELLAPGLATARTVDPSRIQTLGYTRAASELVARTEASIEAARSALASTPLDRTGTIAVRARDVRGTAGVDTRAAEQALGAVLTDAGFDVDLEAPDHELRALFAADTVAIGWLTVESRRDFGDRAPTDKPYFQPGSMDPLEARAVANLAAVGEGSVVVDPLCGTGGLLIEAGLVGARVVGIDAQARMVRGARRNFRAYLASDWAVVRADATRLPLRSPVDAVITDVPYGRQSAVAGRDVDELVQGTLAEARRVAGRAVVVADRNRTADARAAGWTVLAVHERPVHRSLTRFVHVLT